MFPLDSNTTNQIDSSSLNETETAIFHWSLVIIGSMSIALNSLFTSMFIMFRKKFLGQNNNKILLSMTLADNLVGMSCIIFASVLVTKQPQIVYKLTGVIPLFGSMFTSIFSLSTMTLDRLIAIRIPLRYKSLMSPSRVVKLILLCWILPVFATIQEVVIYIKYSWQAELKLRGYMLFVFFSIGSTFLTFSNIYLYTTIRKHARSVAERLRIVQGRERVFSVNSSDGYDPTCLRILQSCRKEIKHAKSVLKEIKAAKLCIKITLMFIICWLPLSSYRLSYSTGNRIGIAWLRRFCLLMAALNSVMNPLVYLLTRANFQKYMWRFLTRKYKFLRRPSML